MCKANRPKLRRCISPKVLYCLLNQQIHTERPDKYTGQYPNTNISTAHVNVQICQYHFTFCNIYDRTSQLLTMQILGLLVPTNKEGAGNRCTRKYTIVLIIFINQYNYIHSNLDTTTNFSWFALPGALVNVVLLDKYSFVRPRMHA